MDVYFQGFKSAPNPFVIIADKTKQQIKDALIVDLNERRGYSTPFKTWMKEEFPAMWDVWRNNSDVAMTGCNLSKIYESSLLRCPEFYQFAESLPGVRILDCHDGISVFAASGDADAESKAGKLRDFLADLTFKKFGIRPVIKVEPVARPDWSCN